MEQDPDPAKQISDEEVIGDLNSAMEACCNETPPPRKRKSPLSTSRDSVSPTMEQDPDPAKQISDEEVIGDLNSAMEACCNETPPPRKRKSPLSTSRDSANEEPDAPPDNPPMKMSSPIGVSIETPNQQRRRREDERVASFCELTGKDVEVARAYLSRCNWDVELAADAYYSGKTFDWQAIDGPTRGQSSSPSPFHTPNQLFSRHFQTLSNAPPPMASSQANVPMYTWVDRICRENRVHREEALYYLEGFNWNFPLAMEACRNKTVVSMREESPESTLNNELISSFCKATNVVSSEEASAYLKVCNWDVNQAVKFFLAGVPVEDVELQLALELSRKDITGPPLPQSLYQAPPQSQSKEGETGSSSSSDDTDPTETERLLAIRKMKGKGKAIEEDSTMEPRTAPVTVTVDIVLADNEMLQIRFKSNQTVRDIHNAIDERIPDGNRGYYLQSQTGVECRDMNMTVQRIFRIGSTETEPDLYKLLQLTL